MLDSYYTPKDAAEKLVSKLGIVPCLVADFCVGGGELLRACETKFPMVKCVAVDKSRRAVRHIHMAHRKWKVFCADFLNNKSMLQTGLESNIFDLVVLNPPFTCRGTRYKIALDGKVFSGSKALLFLVRALAYVRGGGTLRAILPSGTVCTERDAELVKYLKKTYQFRVYWKSSRISFGGKTPNVIFVELRKPLNVAVAAINHSTTMCKTFTPPAYLSRGCLNVADANKIRIMETNSKDNILQYIHTTNLRQGRILETDFWVEMSGHRIVTGPSVLLPRVGCPNRGKICIVASGDSYILSDCLIAIHCKNGDSSRKLKRLIIKEWERYRKIYAGTGAQYTTLKRLSSFLSQIGWNSEPKNLAY